MEQVVKARGPLARSLLIWLVLAVAVAGAAATGSALARNVASPAATPPAVSFLPIDGANIAYRDLNPDARGTSLVMIVGYGSTMAEWDPQLISGLAQGRRVVMFDNRGAGDSTGSVRHLSVHLMAKDAAGVIRGLHLGRADVLG